jgi:hypothetical protein
VENLYIFCAIVVKLPSMAATGLSKPARSSRPRLAMKAGGEMPDDSHNRSGYSVVLSPILHRKSDELERSSIFCIVFA